MIDPSLLAKILSTSGELNGYSGVDGPIEKEVAYDLCEIIESMNLVINTEWPRVLSGTPKDAGEALFEIRENLRHIVYHVKNSEYFNLIVSSKE